MPKEFEYFKRVYAATVRNAACLLSYLSVIFVRLREKSSVFGNSFDSTVSEKFVDWLEEIVFGVLLQSRYHETC